MCPVTCTAPAFCFFTVSSPPVCDIGGGVCYSAAWRLRLEAGMFTPVLQKRKQAHRWPTFRLCSSSGRRGPSSGARGPAGRCGRGPRATLFRQLILIPAALSNTRPSPEPTARPPRPTSQRLPTGTGSNMSTQRPPLLSTAKGAFRGNAPVREMSKQERAARKIKIHLRSSLRPFEGRAHTQMSSFIR